MSKILYWCVFCGYKKWVEAEAEEYRLCPRCEQGMFYEGEQTFIAAEKRRK